MPDQVYKVIEIVGSSRESFQDAADKAVQRAARTIRHLRWFEVAEMRGFIETDKVAYYQITMKLGFTTDDPGL